MKLPDKDIRSLLKETKRPIRIYGTGNGADKIMDELESAGVRVSAITASDGFVRDRFFRGFRVVSVNEAAESYDDPVILPAFGTQREDVMKSILSFAEKYTVLFADVPVYGNTVFDRRYYNENAESIEQVYDMLEDEQSRLVYRNIISFRLSGELKYLTDSFTSKDEAFENILRPTEDEVYLDLGAYRGDTIEELLRYTCGHYRSITALEPDNSTFRKLKANFGGRENVRLFNMGIWNEDTDLCFEASKGRGSSVKASGGNTLAVTTIDTLFRRRKVTYIKTDVEGAEEKALLGGREVIARDKPKMNLALYHRSEDIFSLPLLLKKLNPDYRLYIRQHPHIPAWDLNLYAV